jgi:hypothetical protein
MSDKKTVLYSGTQGQGGVLNIYLLRFGLITIIEYRYTVWQYDGRMTVLLLMVLLLVLNILTLAGAKHS